MATQTRQPEGTKETQRAPESEHDQGAEQGAPPPGLDSARHAANQKAAHGAEILKEVLFPSFMAQAINSESVGDANSYKEFIALLLQDAGNPKDPVEVMLMQQLALAHFRIAQLHVRASDAQNLDSIKVFNTMAARLLGEFRRTALAVRTFQSRAPKKQDSTKLKIFKMAQ